MRYSVHLSTVTGNKRILVRNAEQASILVTANTAYLSTHTQNYFCYDLDGASSKLIMLSGCCTPLEDGVPPLCDTDDEDVEVREAPVRPPAVLEVEDEGSRLPGRRGCVSVLTSSSSSSSSSSMLGQADWSSTRFRRSFRAFRASCLDERDGKRTSIVHSHKKNNCCVFHGHLNSIAYWLRDRDEHNKFVYFTEFISY